MPAPRFLWRIFPTYLLLVVVCLGLVAWHSANLMEELFVSKERADLEAQARLVERQLSMVLDRDGTARAAALTRELGRIAGTRLTLLSSSGVVLGDSEEDPARMENHADRSEIREALLGRTGVATRFSTTLGRRMMYVAIPLRRGSGIAGAVRASVPLTLVDAALADVRRNLLFTGLMVIVLAAVVSFLVARRLARPIELLRRSAERLASGQLETRVHVNDSRELFELAESMNVMAGELGERMETVVRQRTEHEAILSSMVEGVLAVDVDERVLRLNRSAAKLLGIDPVMAEGRNIQEVIRNVHLQKLLAAALASDTPVEGEIVVRDEGERFLQVNGTVLRDGLGTKVGALVVLNDVSRLRRLERVRRDFVANVSHELKTPITSLKGYVETLLDGAMNEPADLERFLRVMQKDADRLANIVEDLLSLARIEQEAEKGEIAKTEGRLRGLLHEAAETYRADAARRGIGLEVICPQELAVRMDTAQIARAAANLIDNAVKYSEANGRVTVEAARVGDRVEVRVRDQGKGIAAEHLPRLFERFYRVDQARSRNLGGTGLGLAIVKHIAQSHGGSVSVESAPGKGSTFTIRLPA